MRIIAPRISPLAIGARVYISAPTQKNKPDFTDFIRPNENYHKPWLYHSFDKGYYDHYLKRIKRGVTQGFFVFDIQTDELVGVININNILLGNIGSASMGYCGDAAHTGQGYMADGMLLALSYALEKMGLHRLEANIQPGNIPSLNLVRKLGFRREGFSPKYLQIHGEWCDHERWAILDEDIRCKKNHI